MRTVHYTFRWLVITSLLFTLGLPGWMPGGIAALASQAHLPVVTQASDCCCETRNGRCCGMVCCLVREAPSPEPTPVPARSDHRDSGSTLLGLAIAKALFSDLEAKSELRIARIKNLAAFAANDSSLQARHLRLNA